MLGSLVLAGDGPSGPPAIAKKPVIGCFDPYGEPNSHACVGGVWSVCSCKGWTCHWSCPEGGCKIRCLAGNVSGNQIQTKDSPPACFAPTGGQGSIACVDNQLRVCKCPLGHLICGWTCPEGGCIRCSSKNGDESRAGGCSDPSDLDLDLRSELDSSPSSCEFPCNCIASGNQIAHKLGVKTASECDTFCKSFPKFCNFWTLIKSRNICFALTNCNYPKCGPPFNNYVSGPKGCPPEFVEPVQESSFTITNQVPNRNAAGNITFQGTGDCDQTYSLAFGNITTIRFPTSCLPLITVSAALNGGIICSPFKGLDYDPRNLFICPTGRGLDCYVTTKGCK